MAEGAQIPLRGVIDGPATDSARQQHSPQHAVGGAQNRMPLVPIGQHDRWLGPTWDPPRNRGAWDALGRQRTLAFQPITSHLPPSAGVQGSRSDCALVFFTLT